jgi:hypothetical protein
MKKVHLLSDLKPNERVTIRNGTTDIEATFRRLAPNPMRGIFESEHATVEFTTSEINAGWVTIFRHHSSEQGKA